MEPYLQRRVETLKHHENSPPASFGNSFQYAAARRVVSAAPGLSNPWNRSERTPPNQRRCKLSRSLTTPMERKYKFPARFVRQKFSFVSIETIMPNLSPLLSRRPQNASCRTDCTHEYIEPNDYQAWNVVRCCAMLCESTA